jgi:hypothetical protein
VETRPFDAPDGCSVSAGSAKAQLMGSLERRPMSAAIALQNPKLTSLTGENTLRAIGFPISLNAEEEPQ